MPRRAFKWDLVDSLPCHAFHACKRFQELNHGLLEKKGKIDEAIFSMQISLSLVRICNSLSLASIAGCFIFFSVMLHFVHAKHVLFFCLQNKPFQVPRKKVPWFSGTFSTIFDPFHSVWKSPKMSHLNFSILAFSTNFCPIKTDLSGNSVWPQALGFQKLAKMDHFWHF